MKKEPIIYFPEYAEMQKNDQVDVGAPLKLGKPSRRYYEHIYPSLNHEEHLLSDLKNLLKLEGCSVKIISILKMKSGSKVAVLREGKDIKFPGGYDKLFSELNKALSSKELVKV